MKNLSLVALALVALAAAPAFAEEDVRNPFLRKLEKEASPAAIDGEQTIIPDKMPEDEASAMIEPTRADPGERDPLLMYGVRDFFVVGTLVSPQEQIAVLRAKGKERMFVRVGDRIGVEKYAIRAIDVGGLSLAKDESILRLPVRNPAMEDIYDTQNR